MSAQPWAVLTALALLALSGCNGSSGGSTTTTPAPDNGNRALEKAFPLHTSVFGVSIRATSNTDKAKVLHAANVMAQYLDNDENGLADNQAVVDELVKKQATLIMVPTEADLETVGAGLGHRGALQDLYGSEVHPQGSTPGQFDATLEEVLHLITHEGYASVYPQIFGEMAESQIADAMDQARGGRFESIPASYPVGAWYTYDDDSCDYSCMVTEYTYWALTSLLGGQSHSGRLEEIQHEWSLNTPQKVKLGDPAVYTLLTNGEYGLATVLPDGHYDYQTFTLSGD
ncbi:hypothetical protein SAMN04488540_11663 [Ferrimonas sediminum]|uniref:Lipoprotein n=1 Tax=Ferrimonas sediminum TaxID=718193 RepID=A0A1G8Y0W2_9GAMM|nr:hypothetical protein [Ferrimonas sediminum]SDJ96367.1 hypothetical protein SAMN04488540_11663 [Ferrimonas sediminum]